jgi:hypothetical protein
LLVYMGLRHPKYADVPEIKAVRNGAPQAGGSRGFVF